MCVFGLAQGDPSIMFDPPRYMRFSPYEYPLVGTMRVKPITESRFFKFMKDAYGQI